MEQAHTGIKIGVAGWSYDDWQDTVYQLSTTELHQPDLFEENRIVSAGKYPSDRLAFLASYVDMIEINSSFYCTPSPKTTASWAKRMSLKPDFFFTAKINKQFTHQFVRDRDLAIRFRKAFEPLRELGCLDALLAQFRYDFRDTADSRRHLKWLADAFGSSPLIVEVRDRSWQSEHAVAFLESLGVIVANLDFPTNPDSFTAFRPITRCERAYLRLHGRNRQAWYSSDVPAYETYNYDYSQAEIGNIATRSRRILKSVKQLTVVANNHYRGKALSAALRLKAALENRRVAIPPALVQTYPDLGKIRCPACV